MAQLATAETTEPTATSARPAQVQASTVFVTSRGASAMQMQIATKARKSHSMT